MVEFAGGIKGELYYVKKEYPPLRKKLTIL